MPVPEWIAPFASGSVFGAITTFALNRLWDFYKERKAKKSTFRWSMEGICFGAPWHQYGFQFVIHYERGPDLYQAACEMHLAGPNADNQSPYPHCIALEKGDDIGDPWKAGQNREYYFLFRHSDWSGVPIDQPDVAQFIIRHSSGRVLWEAGISDQIRPIWRTAVELWNKRKAGEDPFTKYD